MNRKIFCSLLMCGLILITSATSYAIDWIYSFDNGLEQAKEQDKPIMIDFYGESCSWCDVLDKKTYTDEEVNSLAEKFICVKIDVYKNRQVTNKYKIQGLPTIVFLNSEGEEMERIVGYRGPSAFVEIMRKVLSSHAAPAK